MPDSYGLTEPMELIVLRLCSESERFWKRIGEHIDPARMVNPQAKLILGAIRLHEREANGRHPGSLLITLQRVQRLHIDGKIQAARVAEVNDVFDAAMDLGAVDLEAVIAEVAPLLRRQMQGEALTAGMEEFAKRGNFKAVMELLEKATALGAPEARSGGIEVSSGSLAILDLQRADQLRTGILELDLALDGGLPRKSLGTVMADSGGGKSIFLISQAAEASRCGLHTCFATLELSTEQQLVRLVANLTGIPSNSIQLNKDQRKVAEMALHATQGMRGPIHIAEFDPGITTPDDMANFVDDCEQRTGRKVDLLDVDYGDKMTAKVTGRDTSEYLVMRHVWEGLRDKIARPRDMWVWTATQPRRRDRKEQRFKLDMGDAADSVHKVRISDLFITLNPIAQENFEEIDIFVGKNRGGKSRFSVGPVFGDHERARITMTTIP